MTKHVPHPAVFFPIFWIFRHIFVQFTVVINELSPCQQWARAYQCWAHYVRPYKYYLKVLVIGRITAQATRQLSQINKAGRCLVHPALFGWLMPHGGAALNDMIVVVQDGRCHANLLLAWVHKVSTFYLFMNLSDVQRFQLLIYYMLSSPCSWPSTVHSVHKKDILWLYSAAFLATRRWHTRRHRSFSTTCSHFRRILLIFIPSTRKSSPVHEWLSLIRCSIFTTRSSLVLDLCWTAQILLMGLT
jgi:hypothetical protein